MNWRNDAACAGSDPDLWYAPEAEAGGKKEHPADKKCRVEAARAYCAECPVVAECLADARRTGDDHTIRGGLTPEQRHQLNRKDTARSVAAQESNLSVGRAIALARKRSIILHIRDEYARGVDRITLAARYDRHPDRISHLVNMPAPEWEPEVRAYMQEVAS